MLEARLERVGTAIDASVAVKEVHGVEAEYGELVGYDLNLEPATKAKRVALLFGDEAVPDIAVGLKPLVGPRVEDIVREEVIVAKGRDDGNGELLAVIGEGIDNLLREERVGTEDVAFVSGNLLVAIVAGTVASPNDKVDLVLEVCANPIESRVDEGQGRVAIGGFGAVVAGRPLFAMAGDAFCGGSVRLVKGVGMEI
jgi:hypothetical protein